MQILSNIYVMQTLISVMWGALLGILVNILMEKYKKNKKKEKLIRLIKGNNDLIEKDMKEAKKIYNKYLRDVDKGNLDPQMKAHFKNPYLLEELGQELFILKDPLPAYILDLIRKIRRDQNYREFHVIMSRDLHKDAEVLRKVVVLHVEKILFNIEEILKLTKKIKESLSD